MEVTEKTVVFWYVALPILEEVYWYFDTSMAPTSFSITSGGYSSAVSV
jgi:hypothetical protein